MKTNRLMAVLALLALIIFFPPPAAVGAPVEVPLVLEVSGSADDGHSFNKGALNLSTAHMAVGFQSYSTWNGVPEFVIAMDLLSRGELDAESLITHRFPLDKISDAFHAALNKGESGALKVLITY